MARIRDSEKNEEQYVKNVGAGLARSLAPMEYIPADLREYGEEEVENVVPNAVREELSAAKEPIRQFDNGMTDETELVSSKKKEASTVINYAIQKTQENK